MCKTHYVISQDTKADRIYLTKTKDMSHCQEKIIKDIGLAYTEKCSECRAVSATFHSTCPLLQYTPRGGVVTQWVWLFLQRGKIMKGAAAFNYVMKPAATGAMILEASATEMIQFSPFNIFNGAAQMEAKYVLKIKKERAIKVL